MERISAIQMSNLPIPVLGLICCALILSFSEIDQLLYALLLSSFFPT